MGHVDHGKTSLLDAIRGTNVQASEVGGITQNTRAHQIIHKGQKITFIDTPGHEAFSSMRSRGAKVTDLVMLVVAVDDGVQPQTKESIQFALKEKVPVIVAINKVDLPGKKMQKLKQELTTAGLLLEEYGGDVMVVEVSALKKTGLTELLDRIMLLAEMQELKKDKPRGMDGRLFVLESSLTQSQGAVSLCIVKSGSISKNDYMVFDNKLKRARTLLDQNQVVCDIAEQGDPVWAVGADEVLKVGSVLEIYKSEKEAQIASKREKHRDITKTPAVDVKVEPKNGDASESVGQPEAADVDNNLNLLSELLQSTKKDDDMKFLNVIIKADSQGTLEAITDSLNDLNDDYVQIKIINSSTGRITERDVMSAKDVGGIVIGFQVDIDKHVEDVARKEKVLVRTYKVIYDLIDELGEAMNSLVEPEFVDIEVARAKVKKVFVLTNGQSIAGCEVIKGNIIKGYKVVLNRGGEKIAEGKITSLRLLKSEVKEAKKGQECGILVEPKMDIEEGDEIVSVKQERA